MTTPRRHARNTGFTIIELVIVVSIIVVLAGVGMAQYRLGVVRAQEAVLKEDLYRMRDALEQYHADKQKYAVSLEDLVTEGYLRAVPKDPFTQSADTWQLVQSEPDPAAPETAPGVFDVKSGSDRTAMDGSKYSEW